MRYINLHLHYITLHIMPRLAQQHYIQRAVAELDEQIIELRRRQRTDVRAAEHEQATVRTHMAMCDSWYHFHIPPITSVNTRVRAGGLLTVTTVYAPLPAGRSTGTGRQTRGLGQTGQPGGRGDNGGDVHPAGVHATSRPR